MRTKISKHVAILCIVAIVNFVSFAIIAESIGGDGVNGHYDAGGYYLAAKSELTEVGFSVFWYSKVHVYSVWITHILAGLSVLALCAKQNNIKSSG